MKIDYLESNMQSCPLCKGAKFTTLKTNDRYGMGIVTAGCDVCGLIQTNPRPNEAILTRFYQSDYRKFYQNTVHPDQEYIWQNKKYERMENTVEFIKKVKSISESHVKLLDFGCSEGTFFSALIKGGYEGELYGIEQNPEFSEFAKEQTGATVYTSLDAVKDQFDIITLIHVFEHLVNPDDFLQEIRKKLKSTGLLYIDVPDASEYSSLADLHIAHIYHFTSGTLSDLLVTNGYRVINCEKYNPPHHPRSLRIVAMKDREVTQHTITTNVCSEMEVWEKIRKIRVLKYLLRRKAANVRVLRFIYRALISIFKQ